MALKPLFYMLAQHGPWEYHVRVKKPGSYLEAVDWLAQMGKTHTVDYETTNYDIDHKKKDVGFLPGSTSKKLMYMETIFFFNDLGTANYVKLRWG